MDPLHRSAYPLEFFSPLFITCWLSSSALFSFSISHHQSSSSYFLLLSIHLLLHHHFLITSLSYTLAAYAIFISFLYRTPKLSLSLSSRRYLAWKKASPLRYIQLEFFFIIYLFHFLFYFIFPERTGLTSATLPSLLYFLFSLFITRTFSSQPPCRGFCISLVHLFGFRFFDQDRARGSHQIIIPTFAIIPRTY